MLKEGEKGEYHVNHIPKSLKYCPNYVGEWAKIEITMDSGVFTSVVPPECAMAYEVTETNASKIGSDFTATNGSAIHTLGGKAPESLTNAQEAVNIKM